MPRMMRRDQLQTEFDIVKSEAVNVRPAHLPGKVPEQPWDRKNLAELLAFDRGIILPGHQWFFKGTLGQGSLGHAGIWVKYNAHGRMIDRIAIKECYPPYQDWEAKTLWYDDRPGEEVVNTTLNACQDSEHIIKCHSSKIFEDLCMYRVYLESCELGSLEDLIDEHYTSKSERRTDATGQELKHRISERALWAIFEALASALYLMNFGHLPGTNQPVTWEGIIHRDLKPDNIFFSTPHDRF
ncbi:hypothetical protein CLAFUW4_04163 [Fulvia fulva]|uniref:non-specific serine/threonine protein kinase n=1 Tax=Passalora fulva TaxID=5499 RepID=A0A9Q8LHV9_PASFU|nr:uncharacterized protein CLAFUR5_04126 [Fulvia fulva]KAK4626510.1 hypothetical protein CLAFUR4_04149 [Fulvia fulva]KAK4628663.1 hypothetical protein CLAFUR0_04150 [Fulvia fulva]UJO16913.1 hypothetical protein CLAFUR5_04126 [Fulvia fulva]WPV13420.1 hypothetical protein CLAFUW4_04163 [Fulvia fulva]WPV29252.1 hypothetical protein CLAFUW7_04152 [Fulvia fulva]